MQIGKLDHVNVRTANVEAMAEWYGRVLGMPSGKRPNFPFPGAWLYTGDHPAVHLVGVTVDPANADPKIEHYAFSATGLKGFVERLKVQGEKHDIRVVPGFGIVQVNVWDPDGNHIHVDFAPSEPGASDMPGWGNQDAMGRPQT
jgi:catechol 2,3-dioxygenase-like lactoylglutathione lyase family enzyme